MGGCLFLVDIIVLFVDCKINSCPMCVVCAFILLNIINSGLNWQESRSHCAINFITTGAIP